MRGKRNWRGLLLLASVSVFSQMGCLGFPTRPSLPPVQFSSDETAPAGAKRDLPPAETAKVCLATADGLFKSGKDREAIALYERARQHDPRHRHVCRRLAILYDRQGDFTRATAEYQLALELDPKNPDLLSDLGYSYYSRRNWDEAEKTLKKALELNPSHKRAWVNLGMTLAQQQRFAESYQAFVKAIPPAQAHANVGVFLTGHGKREEAKAAYRKALELEPELALARAAMSRLDEPATVRDDELEQKRKMLAKPPVRPSADERLQPVQVLGDGRLETIPIPKP